MKKCICLLLLVVVIGCDPGKDEKNENTANNDSVGVENKVIAMSFDEKLFAPLSLPLIIDTNFILEVDTNNRIPYQQIRQLGVNFLQHETASGIIYDINSFCEIDSIKQAGGYREYLEKMEIGMTKIAISFKLGVIPIPDNTKLFVWGIHNSSYEACPFFAGTTIIGTYVNENNENIHFLLGEISGGGDPPSMGNDEVISKINKKGIINLKAVSVNDDLDIPGQEITTQKLTLKLEKGKIVIVHSSKQSKSTEKTVP